MSDLLSIYLMHPAKPRMQHREMNFNGFAPGPTHGCAASQYFCTLTRQ
jgi:hypothetical protein